MGRCLGLGSRERLYQRFGSQTQRFSAPSPGCREAGLRLGGPEATGGLLPSPIPHSSLNPITCPGAPCYPRASCIPTHRAHHTPLLSHQNITNPHSQNCPILSHSSASSAEGTELSMHHCFHVTGLHFNGALPKAVLNSKTCPTPQSYCPEPDYWGSAWSTLCRGYTRPPCLRPTAVQRVGGRGERGHPLHSCLSPALWWPRARWLCSV